MAFIKKEHSVVKREFQLEGPVSELLDDYAKFLESSVDHIVNSALKKLWRDQDYRKWRDDRRNSPANDTRVKG